MSSALLHAVPQQAFFSVSGLPGCFADAMSGMDSPCLLQSFWLLVRTPAGEMGRCGLVAGPLPAVPSNGNCAQARMAGAVAWYKRDRKAGWSFCLLQAVSTLQTKQAAMGLDGETHAMRMPRSFGRSTGDAGKTGSLPRLRVHETGSTSQASWRPAVFVGPNSRGVRLSGDGDAFRKVGTDRLQMLPRPRHLSRQRRQQILRISRSRSARKHAGAEERASLLLLGMWSAAVVPTSR